MIECEFYLGLYAGDEIQQSDTNAPVITAPSSQTFYFANGGAGLAHSELSVFLSGATAQDDFDGSLTVTNNLASLANPLPVGDHTITFSATDAAGNTGTAQAVVTVAEAAVTNSAPVISDQTFSVNAGADLTIDIANYVTDADGDTLTYAVSGSADVSNGATASQFVFNSATVGDQAITVTVDDGNGGTASATFTITVNAVAPSLTVMGAGSSLSNAPVEPSGVTMNVYEEVEQICAETGANITFTTYIYGGRQLDDHAADSALMADIPNHDILILQGGTGDSANYEADATPIVANANTAAFFLRWERQGAIGEYTSLRANIAGAATNLGADLIEIGDVWQDLVANTSIDFFADLTHQNLNGSYVNALCIYRYLTGESVASINYTPAQLTLTAQDILTIKTAVDTHITQSYTPAVANTATVDITAATATVTEGNDATFTATATDSATGDLSANITWQDDLGNNLGTGASITAAMNNSGSRVVTASVVGSDGKTSVDSVAVTVNPLSNAAPVAQNTSVTIGYNEPFTQKSLLAFVTDDGTIDWSTLIISQPTNGSVAQNGDTASTIDFDYSGTNFSGADSITYSVADTQGARSNTATINITVQAQSTAEPVWISAGLSSSQTPPNGETYNLINLKTLGAVALDNTSGSASGWTLEITSAMSADSSVQAVAGTNDGFLPDVLMMNVQYLTATFESKFTGLTVGKTYQIELTGSRSGGAGRAQDVVFGSATGTFEAGGNRTDGVTLSAVADANGEIILTVSPAATGGNGYAYVSGLILSEV